MSQYSILCLTRYDLRAEAGSEGNVRTLIPIYWEEAENVLTDISCAPNTVPKKLMLLSHSARIGPNRMDLTI